MNENARKLLAPWSSLRLTVVLLAAATFLVFAGTVAQIDKGIWTVVDEYFRCAFTWIDFRIFFPRAWDVPGGIWFPGGWLIAGLLLINVVAAHAVRFKAKARGSRLTAGLLVIAAGAALVAMIIAGVFDSDIAHTEEAAFWRVLLRLGKGGGAALVLMAGCLLVFGRRAGIVLIHGGIILMLVSEFFTGTFAEEGQMRIEAGTPMNYVEHRRAFEIAITDRSDPAQDRVQVVALDRLLDGPVRDASLPVSLELVQFMSNSQLVDASSMPGTGPGTIGAAQFVRAIERPEAAGTDASQTIDVPAGYVDVRGPDGTPVGTYLLSPWFRLRETPFALQDVVVDGRKYDLELRFKRTYKPYTIDLIEFRHDKYVGTETPKNFSSVVRLVDEGRQVDRTVKIWMNNPLRYAGETFYQSSYEPGRQVTVLQVVRNGGWMIPYLSCMIVGVGMIVHMGGQMTDFLRRRRAA